MSGVFISFEGIDGSGKSTQLDLLKNELIRQGRTVVVAQEPGGTRVGQQIRKLLLDAANTDLRPLPELLLYFASRAQNIEQVIRPALERGDIVLVDRFTDATLAYQGCGRNLGAETVRAVEKVACGGLKPDLTILIDIDPGVGVSRALNRNTSQAADESRMEQEGLEFFERIRQGYLALSRQETERIKVIDGRESIEQVAARVQEVVREFFRCRAGEAARG